jgi:hypothetical protein
MTGAFSENALPIVSTGTETIGEWTGLHSNNLELAMSQYRSERDAITPL